mmetsp:Transcript_53176/g.171496  ORF Transcript_53176/g.171496 Transcript_53176/m.171496 type:complete len:87 (-) Transcript_53176:12-272(-)
MGARSRPSVVDNGWLVKIAAVMRASMNVATTACRPRLASSEGKSALSIARFELSQVHVALTVTSHLAIKLMRLCGKLLLCTSSSLH